MEGSGLRGAEIAEGLVMPAIAFGTGVVRRYTRNPLLRGKVVLRQWLSTIKHGREPKSRYIDRNASRMVRNAYDAGFRAFDSGRIYGYSEPAIGQALSGVDRGEYFLVTKVSDMDVERDASPDDVAGNLSASLSHLGTDHVDLYLLHWPHGDWIGIYRQMEEERERGRARAVGVANCGVAELEALERAGAGRPAVNQIECHPLNVRGEVVSYCRERGIAVMAHTPTAQMRPNVALRSDLVEIAGAHGRSVAQVILRWHHQNGRVPVVSTTSPEHMAENLDIGGFELDAGELEAIDRLDEGLFYLPGCGIDDPNYVWNL